jgi:hypothetical protein
MTRGWTYQEGLLSRRRIFFTEEQVYFECHGRHCFESTAPLLNEVVWRASQKGRIFSIGGQSIGQQDFYKIVNEYSGRKLTYESDILNGVWGVLRTFHSADCSINHYWGVPLYLPKSTDKIVGNGKYLWGFAWDLTRPGWRRSGFPSWSWAGWLGQVKPTLLVNSSEHVPTSEQIHAPDPTHTLHRASVESTTVETPHDVLQSNLPVPLDHHITFEIERSDGVRLSYDKGSQIYRDFGGTALSPFLIANAWMMPASLEGYSGHPVFPMLTYQSLNWMPTTVGSVGFSVCEPYSPCICIFLAAREPLAVERLRRRNGLPSLGSFLDDDYDLKEGEVVNNSWLCLFLVVVQKGSWFERIGLVEFLFSERKSMQSLIQDLKLQKTEIRLG